MTPPTPARILSFVLIALLIATIGTAAASTVLPDYRHITVSMANGGDKYIKFDASGLNALHITTDPSSPYGQATSSDVQSGTFYLTDTGGRGYSDDGILLVAVREPLRDDLRLRIRSSGYTWTPSPEAGTMPAEIAYADGAVDATFGKGDFVYGPQTWRPSSAPNYPLFAGQSGGSAEGYLLMFVDLRAGVLGTNGTASGLTDNGAIRIHYSFENLDTFAAFNVYAWTLNSNQGEGISWTNAAGGTGASGYTVNGVARPTPTETGTPAVSPTVTATATPAVSPSLSAAPTPTSTSVPGPTPTEIATPVITVTDTPSAAPTLTSTSVPSPTPTESATPVITVTDTPSASPTVSGTPPVSPRSKPSPVATVPTESRVPSISPLDPSPSPPPVLPTAAPTSGGGSSDGSTSRDVEGYTGVTAATEVRTTSAATPSGSVSPVRTPPENATVLTTPPTTLPFLDIGDLQEYTPLRVLSPWQSQSGSRTVDETLASTLGVSSSSDLTLFLLILIGLLLVLLLLAGVLITVLMLVLIGVIVYVFLRKKEIGDVG